MSFIKKFIENKLKLKVNGSKSEAAKSDQIFRHDNRQRP